MVLSLRLKKTGGTESTKIRLDEVPKHPAISAAILLLRCLAELSFLAEAKLKALSFFPKAGDSKLLRKEAPSFVLKSRQCKLKNVLQSPERCPGTQHAVQPASAAPACGKHSNY